MKETVLDEAQGLLLKLLMCGPDQVTLTDVVRLEELLEDE